MAQVHFFTFNAFAENTYIIADGTKECIIIDPGCHTASEQRKLVQFIEDRKLQPVALVNTHCHIDHVFGNHFISDKYQLPLAAHEGEAPVLDAAVPYGKMMGLNVTPSPPISVFLEGGQTLRFGETVLDILFTPGHSPASLSFYCSSHKWVIAGDVLFRLGIGRTDLPGGNMNTLLQSIEKQLFTLPDDTTVWSGHGEKTTIGYEKRNNPFLR